MDARGAPEKCDRSPGRLPAGEAERGPLRYGGAGAPANPQAARWASWVVITATATVIAPMTVTTSWSWHVSAAILLIALAAVAVTVTGPAPLRTVVYLGVVFVLFTLGTHAEWPPAVTTVLVCLLPLAVLLVASRGGRLKPGAPWLRVGQRPTLLVLLLAVSTVVGAGAALSVWTLVVTPPAPSYLADLQRYPLWLVRRSTWTR